MGRSSPIHVPGQSRRLRKNHQDFKRNINKEFPKVTMPDHGNLLLGGCLIADRLKHTCVVALPLDVVGPRCATRVSALTSRKRLTLAAGAYSPSLSPTTHATPMENATLDSHGSTAPHPTALAPGTHRPRDHLLHVGARVE
ncbi:hypothetical protein ALC60_08624 [Trachymyrmex zeteki]|uniref:Uncharacterized protein n=1 Tax=Mycetomoellerius zeteki TaxID=64791 RepID=A0A151WVW4_9HYME|nr:hypothetical protein ALC60_08624 [Trachymyrmex zeteki]